MLGQDPNVRLPAPPPLPLPRNSPSIWYPDAHVHRRPRTWTRGGLQREPSLWLTGLHSLHCIFILQYYYKQLFNKSICIEMFNRYLNVQPYAFYGLLVAYFFPWTHPESHLVSKRYIRYNLKSAYNAGWSLQRLLRAARSAWV